MNKKLIVIIIVILVICLTALSTYKFAFYDKGVRQHYFDSIKLNNYKEDTDENEILDSVTYKDYIITEKLLSIDYNFLHDSESITGNVYIGTDKYLYINDTNSNKTHRVSTTKFKTMYAKDYEYINGIYIYLLSYSNNPYLMCLESNDITKVEIIDLDDERKYTNFVDIRFKEDKFESGNTVFLLSESGNIYETSSRFRYNDEIISLYNSMYIYGDKTIVNTDGMIAQDKNGNSYKIKYVFDTYQNNKFIPNNKIIIVTEDNKFIYFDDNMETVYEFSKKVKDVSFDVYYPYVEGNLKVTFEDDYSVDFKASCNQYFCVNEFAE